MLQQIFEQQKFTDITFILDDGSIKCHRCVLAASAVTYFDKLFNSDNEWSESNTDTIVIKECSKDAFLLLIKSIYGYKLYNKVNDINNEFFKPTKDKPLPSFDPQLVTDLLLVGDRFGSAICLDTVKTIIKSQVLTNVIDWLPYLLKIFRRFSPSQDSLLRDNLTYTVKMISFSIKDNKTLTLHPRVGHIINKMKLKYVLYLAGLNKTTDILRPIVEQLLKKYTAHELLRLINFEYDIEPDLFVMFLRIAKEFNSAVTCEFLID
ncbi:MAG: hypothetical protein Barrevirus12_5 [Barrevirus sp.]|uniref:BTB domain-containing protein n=1 Tax=Barrevirus sp. TaxID=2487763 RepID=A0A3G4ZQC6_9VIRU|nr:MAG: hypothetical protein Barrevirus12_5 [Barrevirus sp.]